MTENATESSSTHATPEMTVVPGSPNVIYADRILNLGIGPAVTKLALGLEVGTNTYAQFAQLVVPTQGLLEVLAFMSNTISENHELKQGIIQALEKFKEQLSQTA